MFKKIVYTEPTFKGAYPSHEAIDLIRNLLKKDPEKRIKPENILKHPWFKNIDFNDVLNLKVIPPFKPKVVKFYLFKKNEEDLSNIDPLFLNEAVNSPGKHINLNFDQSKCFLNNRLFF